MGDSKLCLLLLLSTSALAVAQDGDQPTCLLAQRYKTLHKYQYRYEAESLNAINGASALKNGPKASCMVEIEVPQTCSFIVRTTDCSLSEVVDMDAEGNPVFAPAPTSDAFAAEMARHPLKVVVEGVYDVELYPEEGETTTILNIKRGIISALAVPLTEEDKNKNMPTIHGKCKTAYTINAREDIATDITLNRDLSRCDNFVPMRDHTSPLALISGMHYPLAQLVRSSQTCNYKFDNERKHMTSGSCTENHILIPFSHKGEYGVTNVGKQELTLVDVSAHNDRVFERSDIVKGLHMEAVEEKTAVQDKDAWLALLRELATLPETEGDRRAHLFHKLVTMVRGMKTETLTPAIPEALEVSRLLTYQVLAQCGTPECSSAIMQILRTFDSSSLEVDATVVAMGLVSNPSALLIHDMLEMAKYKSSKPIMYALSNVVKRFYKREGKMIPEIHSVAEFMAAQLGDCSGDKDNTFMTLRVVGNMAPAVVPASPALRAAVMQCVNQPAASPAVQQAAIQVYRLTPVPEEAREVLMQVLLDTASALQKRIAAYLVLMKDPQPSELAQLVSAMTNEQDQQMKSFVISHMTNIMSSTEPETTELRDKIQAALQGNEIGPIMDATKFSRNYKIGSVEGNMIFEGSSYLPRELMLEMTLKAFGFDIDMMEIGMEGKGFEPTVDALFGENGFFPDTTLKTMYFVSDNMPLKIQEVMQYLLPALRRDRMKRQASQNLMREVGRNLNKLVSDLKAAESPEAMVYLRLLGNELGYLRTNEMEEMAYSAAMMIDNMLKMFPAGLIMEMMTKTDNTMFAHYIFMDNEFFMPTATGVPLRIALSGTFTPGIKGGLKISRDMSEVAFMPSAGVEFATQVGSHIPEYVDSGLEMLTNIFHESGLTAKISMERDQVKLTIPAPMNPTKIIKMTNTLVAVTGSEVKPMPPMVTDKVDVSECTPFFAGMKYCTALQYTDAFSVDTAPYFPFTGDSKFAVELHPTGEVTEYTATVAYELLREGEEGRQKVDSVKFIVRAEGAAPTEARAIMKYNRRRNVLTANFEIPDYDLEAGFRLGVVDGNTKGKGTHSISLDLINKNVPQLSLVGRAKLEAMRKGMLQVQLLVPFLSTDATVTALMTREEELEMELKSEIKVLEAMSEQKIEMKYDGTKVEVKVKSGVNADTTMMPNADVFEKYGNQLLDTQMGQTDMKVREVFVKFVEVANNYMGQYADIPYIQNLRVPDMPEISLPESLFLNTEAKAVYYFNDEHLTIAVPLPLGGKSTEELFPRVLTTPHMSLPRFGLEITSMEIPIPEMFVPESITLSIPLFGKAQVSALMKSNLYDMEASMAAGKDVVEAPSYSAMFDVRGTSPIDILSFKVEGSGMLATTDSVKAQLKSSLAHKFIEASVSIVEDASITDKLNVKSSSKIEVTSPLGLNIALEHTGLAGINTEEISADSNFDGVFQAGPIYGKAISTQTSTIFPFRPEAKIDSSVQIDCSIVKAQNTIAATLANGEFSVVSNTNAFEDTITHVGELSFKDNKLALTCDANAAALGMKIRNQAEASAGAGEIVMRIETNGDHSENRIYSLLTASLDVSGVSVNSDATVRLFENEATHKVVLTLNKDGLTTTGTNTLQSPLSVESTFSGALDTSRATLSIINKAATHDITIDNANALMITLSSLDFTSKAEASASGYASYTHDITVDLKPYIASANVNNNLKVLAANFINEAQLQVELSKMGLTGNVKAIYGEEEIKHTYEMNYADLRANAKYSTTGRLFGNLMSHNTELEIIGLAAKFTNDARFNSHPLRFDHTVRGSLIPFDFNLESIFTADGDLMVYGKHSAQLYSKLLLKAQPLAFASSHEGRASFTQQLDNSLSLKTMIDSNMDTVLSLQEQRTSFTMKSKLNEHMLNQEISVYNSPERIGMEISNALLTNIINSETAENQEFSISGFLKYDKSTSSHVINFPLMENLPYFLESIKGLFVQVTEAVQNYINTAEFQSKLEALPKHVDDFIDQLNIEEKLTQLQQQITDFTQNYAISMDDIEASLRNLRSSVVRLLTDLAVNIRYYSGMMRDTIVSTNFPETIEMIQQKMHVLVSDFDFKALALRIVDTIRDMIDSIDLEKLIGSSIEFLHDIEVKYDIKAKLHTALHEVKQVIAEFDVEAFVTKVTSTFAAYFEKIVSEIPTEMLSNMTEYFRELFDDIDITGRVETFYAKVRELILQFEADKKFEAVLAKVIELIKRFRIEETARSVVNMVRSSGIFTKSMQIFESTINYVKATDVKEMITQLNMYMGILEEKLNAFDYNDFVDHINQMIATFATNMNDLVRSLEVPQKLEALRDFANFVIASFKKSVEQMREIQFAEYMNAVLNHLQVYADYMKQEITNLDVNAKVTSFLQFANKLFNEFITTTQDMFTSLVEDIKRVKPELLQIIEGLVTKLKNAEIDLPSFTIPLTDLVVPSMKVSIDTLRQFEIPTQLDIPEFTILGTYVVQARTVSTDDIKQTIIELIDFILNLEIKLFDMGASIGNAILTYLPSMPEFSIPEVTVPEFTFPTLPSVPSEELIKTLQLPNFRMPVIPTEISIPGFGKLSYEVKVNSPICTIRNAAEVQSSADVDNGSQLTSFLTSQGTSVHFEILNFNLDSTARIAVFNADRVIASETFKFSHTCLAVDHHASVTFNDFLPQASAKTTVKATTAPYNAELFNEAYLATKGGLTANSDTAYKHVLNMPAFGLAGETSVTQKTTARQEGTTITVIVGNQGTATLNAHENTHKSDGQVIVSPKTVRMTFNSDTDTFLLKTKQTLSADSVILRYFKLDVRSEAEGPAIKSSILTGSVNADLGDLKLEIKGMHSTELTGIVSGLLHNAVDFALSPSEILFDLQNKGNTKVNFNDAVTAKLDLQNDYSATFTPGTQHMKTVALARLNQNRLAWNFTVENNERKAAIISDTEGQADLEILTRPFTIPEIHVPFFDVSTPAIRDVDIYEQTGLKDIFPTTEQTIDVNAKIVYEKSQATPIVNVMELIQIPAMGNLITELSFKSAIINLNVNAGLYSVDDFVFRLGATTASVFESLKAKLDGTTSLTTKRGIKLANSLSLENSHLQGTHDSTISMSTDNLETAVSVATIAKIALPILNLEASQNLIADTKTKAKALSTLKMKCDFSIPMIRAVGKADADHSLKVIASFEDVSMESAMRANMDGTVLNDYLALGMLDTDFNVYLSKDGLRSTSKVISDAKLNRATTKVFSMDINENLAVEASLSRVYTVLNYISNNEVNLFSFNTNGKHVAQATLDLTPTSSLTADVEIDVSQPSSLGDFSVFEKSVAEVTVSKQVMSSKARLASPLYTTNMAVEMESNIPVFKITFKSAATSAFVILNYDLGYSFNTSFGESGVSMTGTGAFTHTEFNVQVQHALSESRVTLNVDVTSPAFTDVNLRWVARKDGISATVSIPSTGFLGYQLNVKLPSQMNARLYGRYASEPGKDVEIFAAKASVRDVNRVNIKMIFNMDAPDIVINGLQQRIPAITSCLFDFAEKYQLLTYATNVKIITTKYIEEAQTIAYSHDPNLSEVSVLFRNTIVRYHDNVQAFLDTIITTLRETQVKFPGVDQMMTLSEAIHRVTSSVKAVLQRAVHMVAVDVEYASNAVFDVIRKIQVTMPIRDVVAGGKVLEQIRDRVRALPNPIVSFLRQNERLDTLLETLSDALRVFVNNAQDFVDSGLKSDFLEATASYTNVLYGKYLSLMESVIDLVNIDAERINGAIYYILHLVRTAVHDFTSPVTDYLQQVPARYGSYINFKGNNLEINL